MRIQNENELKTITEDIDDYEKTLRIMYEPFPALKGMSHSNPGNYNRGHNDRGHNDRSG